MIKLRRLLMDIITAIDDRLPFRCPICWKTVTGADHVMVRGPLGGEIALCSECGDKIMVQKTIEYIRLYGRSDEQEND